MIRSSTRRYPLPEWSSSVLQSIMVFYGLAVALMAASVSKTYSDVSKITSGEATSLAALYRNVGGYPEPISTRCSLTFATIRIRSSTARRVFGALLAIAIFSPGKLRADCAYDLRLAISCGEGIVYRKSQMAKPDYIELPTGDAISILYEDRSVLAIDKPRGWMLVPASWQKTSRNLQMAITSSIAAKDFWARSRNLKFLRFVHRIDADTTGILLFAKSLGAVNTFGDLFESRKMEKTYLAVAHGVPKQTEWTCRQKLGPDAEQRGKMRVDPRNGKEAETIFRVLQVVGNSALIEARPYTGRTHQIRVHLADSGHPIVGDEMYGSPARKEMALRAIGLEYQDPFTKRRVRIRAPVEEFCRKYGFQAPQI